VADKTYRCRNAKAIANRIWEADFFLDSFNELVDSADPDTTVASVGLSDVFGVDQRLRTVTTLHNHPWSQEIVELLIEYILNSDPPLPEWSIEYKYLSWTVTMAWRD
jgi:hypothetical protein